MQSAPFTEDGLSRAPEAFSEVTRYSTESITFRIMEPLALEGVARSLVDMRLKQKGEDRAIAA